ncbi:unnamed protein product, partial [Effrenium voratum]
VADDQPLRLDSELWLRLRAAHGSALQAGSQLRIFLWPLTQWALDSSTTATC